jgi:hypothetical protein
MRRRRFINTQEDDSKEVQNLAYLGYKSNDSNDVAKDNLLVYATDTRIPAVGRQKTRQGCDPYTVPAGEALDASQTSTTGAADQSVATTWLGAKFTATANKRLTKAELNLKNAASATGPIIVKVYSDSSGSPGTLLATSSVAAGAVAVSYGYCAVRFMEAPLLANGTAYWLVAYLQDDGTGAYSWSSTTNATTAKTSTSAGVSWSSTTYALNIKVYLSTDGGVRGHFRARKSDGTEKTLLAYKEAAGTTAVATVNDLTGALTAIKTGLSSSATYYDFWQVNDTVYYVNGFDAPRKWDFTTEAAMGGSPGVARRGRVHKNQTVLQMADDAAHFILSDIAAYETFTSTSFFYVPWPKSNDPVSNWEILNDNLYFLTHETKWALFGSDISNMILRKVPGSKGTTAPDSVVQDGNYIYFAGADNVYAFNGSSDKELFDDIVGEYKAAANRNDMGAVVWNNRYYLFYTPPGGGQNSRCWVYNTLYGRMESNDTMAYAQRCNVWNDDDLMIQGSNLVGALYYAELPSNTFNSLGSPLDWDIRTRYEHYEHPQALKEVEQWFPRFSSVGGAYSVECLYDYDFLDSPVSQEVSLQSAGYIWDDAGTIWDEFTWDTSALIAPELTMSGEANYIQRRYRRSGVNNPVEFLGDSHYYQIRRP